MSRFNFACRHRTPRCCITFNQTLYSSLRLPPQRGLFTLCISFGILPPENSHPQLVETPVCGRFPEAFWKPPPPPSFDSKRGWNGSMYTPHSRKAGLYITSPPLRYPALEPTNSVTSGNILMWFVRGPGIRLSNPSGSVNRPAFGISQPQARLRSRIRRTRSRKRRSAIPTSAPCRGRALLISGFGFRISGFGFWVQGFSFRHSTPKSGVSDWHRGLRRRCRDGMQRRPKLTDSYRTPSMLT